MTDKKNEETIKLAQKIGYMYVAPFVMAIGIFGSLANMVGFISILLIYFTHVHSSC